MKNHPKGPFFTEDLAKKIETKHSQLEQRQNQQFSPMTRHKNNVALFVMFQKISLEMHTFICNLRKTVSISLIRHFKPQKTHRHIPYIRYSNTRKIETHKSS